MTLTRPLLLLLLALCAATPAGAEDVLLPTENTPVDLKGFPGYALTRKGQEIIVTRDGKKLRGLDSPAAGADTAGKPDALVHDLDFDGVPELFILQAATREDSVYTRTHVKPGAGQNNYLFSQWPNAFFADPLFDPATRTLTERTSAGHSRVYAWEKNAKPDELRYRLIRETLPERAASPKEQERAAFFAAGGRLPDTIRPLLPADLPRTFMPGALPIDDLPLARQMKSWHSGPLRRGTGVSVDRLTPDGRWVHAWGGDDTRQGWVPVKALFVETAGPVELASVPGESLETPLDCPASLPAGSQLLLLGGEKNEDGSSRLDVRTSCGRVGRIDSRLLRLPE